MLHLYDLLELDDVGADHCTVQYEVVAIETDLEEGKARMRERKTRKKVEGGEE